MSLDAAARSSGGTRETPAAGAQSMPGPTLLERPAALTLTVAFAGHRKIGDESRLRAATEEAIRIIGEAAQLAARAHTAASTPDRPETLLSAHAQVLPDAQKTVRLNLLCGYTVGADRIAVDRWIARRGDTSDLERASVFGPVWAVFPYADPDDENNHAWTDRPYGEDAYKLSVHAPEFDTHITLDGRSSEEGYPVRHAHLEQSRWLVRWSEIILVAWNGGPSGGAGGTGDLVALAIAANQPVVWIDTASGDYALRLINAEAFWRDNSFDEVRATLERDAPHGVSRAVEPLTVDALALQIADRAMPPGEGRRGHARPRQLFPWFHPGHHKDDFETESRRLYFEELPDLGRIFGPFGSAASAVYSWCYRRLAKAAAAAPASIPAPQEPELVRTALDQADAKANRLGNLHRSSQVILLVVAALAVLVGTLPAVFPYLKLPAVLTELLLILFAQRFYHRLVAGKTHYRWGDARRLAERLRALCATWPLGFDVGDERSGRALTWTEWYTRIIRRTVGSPTRFMSATRRNKAAQSALAYSSGIAAGQAAYHELTHRRMHRFHAVLKAVEFVAFSALVLAIAAYLVVFRDYHLHTVAGWFGSDFLHDAVPPPPFFSSGLLVLSAFLPAVAAACMGIEAKLLLIDQSLKSEALHHRYAAIVKRFAEDHRPQQREELLREAATVLVADVDRWREAAAQRGIVVL